MKYLKKTTVLFGTGVLALGLAACSDGPSGGGDATIPAPPTQAPVTQAPVTQEPTTQAPVTQEPVTQEPVTPTDMPSTEQILLGDWRSECEGGNMVSCDLLYYYSDMNSEDEAVGASCGNTGGTTPCSGVDLDATDYGQDYVLDGLYDDCEGGNMRACDDLYFLAPSGSPYTLFGGSCGGRQADDYSFYCSN